MTQRIWETSTSSWRRRSLLVSVGVGLAALISLLSVYSSSRATSGGSAYAVPAARDIAPSPAVFETFITSDERTVDIGQGTTANAQTYNGTIPGPTIRATVGDTIIVHYTNRLEHESGIHWHGIELANSQDGTPFTQNQVEPGGNFLYKFVANRPGIYWYHPHHHASTNQVFKGLYGLILVEDPNENQLQSNGTLPSDAQTKPLVLSDITVCKAPGSNPIHAYNDNDDTSPGSTQPHPISNGANDLPHQPDPSPKNLCEGPAVAGDPYPIDEDGNLRGAFAAGDVPNIQTFDHAGRTNEGNIVLTNGRQVGLRNGGLGGPNADGNTPGPVDAGAEQLDVRPGQGLRLQLLNASAVRYMRLHLTKPDGSKVDLIRVGGEGGVLNNAFREGGVQGAWNTKYDTGEILLGPGSRADVVAAIPTSPTTGTYTLWTRDFQRVGLAPGWSNVATVPVMHLNLQGSTVSPAYTIANGTPLRAATGDPQDQLGSPTGGLKDPGTFSPPKAGSANSTISLAQGGNEARIDATRGDHDFPGIDYKNAPHLDSSRYIEQGDVIDLFIFNSTGAHHPFHPHGFSIQPRFMDCPAATDFNFITAGLIEFRDNIDIPPNCSLQYRVRFDPRPMPDGTSGGGALGRWVFHCHIFFHATNGMLSEFVTTSPSGNEKPDVNVNNYALRVPIRRRTVNVGGTYGDRDGDPITLSASAGQATDNGGGSFSWRLRRFRGGNRFIYITARDSNGLRGQIPFWVNGAPRISRLRVQRNRIKFRLAEAAKVRFKAKRIGGGARRTFRRSFKTGGRKRVRLPRRLPPGRYKLTAKATDLTGLPGNRAKTRFAK